MPGGGQAYRSQAAINKKNKELVGQGIYCSPEFTTCFGYA